MRTLSLTRGDSMTSFEVTETPPSSIYLRAADTPEDARAQLAKALQYRRKRAPALRYLPQVSYPTHIERAYASILRKAVEAIEAELRATLIPQLPRILGQEKTDSLRLDALPTELEIVLGTLTARFGRVFAEDRIRAMARQTGISIAEYNQRMIQRGLASVLNINLVAEEPWLAEIMERFVSQNVTLITSVQTSVLDDIKKKVLDAGLKGIRYEDLAKDIMARVPVAENKAKLIARDQIGTFYGQLTRQRQTKLGITKYMWVATKDERTRPEHRHRDGKIFYWDEDNSPAGSNVLPPGERPGEPINCRCSAKPLLDEILENLKS